MNIFQRRHFKYDIIIWAVRWYCQYGISYRDLEKMLLEREVEVDHSTIYRWVQYYAPKILDKLKWYWKPQLGFSWRVIDDTYIIGKRSRSVSNNNFTLLDNGATIHFEHANSVLELYSNTSLG